MTAALPCRQAEHKTQKVHLFVAMVASLLHCIQQGFATCEEHVYRCHNWCRASLWLSSCPGHVQKLPNSLWHAGSTLLFTRGPSLSGQEPRDLVKLQHDLRAVLGNLPMQSLNPPRSLPHKESCINQGVRKEPSKSELRRDWLD
jgi:hypothetical protein